MCRQNLQRQVFLAQGDTLLIICRSFAANCLIVLSALELMIVESRLKLLAFFQAVFRGAFGYLCHEFFDCADLIHREGF